MSFVDMMSNYIWSKADIDNKVQAMIRSKFSENDELKAARLARSSQDPEFVAAVDAWIAHCVEEGRDALQDMNTLHQVFAVEAAERRLSLPVVEPELDSEGSPLNQDVFDQDVAERDAAQAVIDVATPEVMQWVDARRPPSEPEEIEMPVTIEDIEVFDGGNN